MSKQTRFVALAIIFVTAVVAISTMVKRNKKELDKSRQELHELLSDISPINSYSIAYEYLARDKSLTREEFIRLRADLMRCERMGVPISKTLIYQHYKGGNGAKSGW